MKNKEFYASENVDFKGKNIFIVGKPGSGKTTLANIIAAKNKSHILIHSDDYIGRESDLKRSIELMCRSNTNYILEGVQAYDLFTERQPLFYPDLIIEIEVSDRYIKNLYDTERDPSKYHMAITFHKYRKIQMDDFLKKHKQIKLLVYKNASDEN